MTRADKKDWDRQGRQFVDALRGLLGKLPLYDRGEHEQRSSENRCIQSREWPRSPGEPRW